MLSENALKIFETLYSKKGETVNDTFRRVAEVYGKTDEEKKLAFKLQKDNIWRGNTPVYFNAGKRPFIPSACFVTGLEDSMDSIYDIANIARKIFQVGSGIGIPIGNLREKSAYIYEGKKDVAPEGKSSGPLSFMKLYDAVGATTKSGGRVRRAAIMCVMPVWHPDILDFIKAKEIDGTLSNMNISVTITDNFMQALEDNVEFILHTPSDGSRVGTIDPWDVWDEITNMSHKTADPGVMFIDTVNRMNPLKKIMLIQTSNPCGEQTLCPFFSCNLSMINVAKFINGRDFDFKELFDISYKVTTLMNNLIDVMDFPDERFKINTLKYRPIGIGLAGLADAMFLLDIPYNSKRGCDFAAEVMRTITHGSVRRSAEIAKEDGPIADYEIVKEDLHEIIEKLISKEGDEEVEKTMKMVKEHGVRNCQHTTAQPTGCQEENSLLITNNGIYRFNELVNKHGELWQNIDEKYIVCQEQNSNVKDCFISKGYNNGQCNTKKIIMNSGLEIESTFNHKFRAIRNGDYLWLRADELSIGDIIPTRIGGYEKKTEPHLNNLESYRSRVDVKFPDKMNKKLAWFLGLFFADGDVHGRSIRITLHGDDVKTHLRLKNFVKELFGLELKKHKCQKGNCYTFFINSVPLIDWLKINGLLKSYSHEVLIPKVVRESSKNSLIAFINGYICGDGSIDKNRRRKKRINTTSKRMAQDLLVVLRAIGINANIKTWDDRKNAFGNRSIYEIDILKYGSNNNKFSSRYIKREIRDDVDVDPINKIINTSDMFVDKIVDIVDSNCYTLDVSVGINLGYDEQCYLSNNVISHNTCALSCDCSYGIEPCFGLVFQKNVIDGSKMIIANNVFEERFKNESWYSEDLLDKILSNGGSLKNVRGIPKEVREIFVVAHDIKWKDRVDMQSSLQKHCSTAISSTVNLPSETSVTDVSDLFKYAHKKGLKGITIYRDGCKKFQPVTFKKEGKGEFVRPTRLKSDSFCVGTSNGDLYITVSYHNDKPVEIFLQKGKPGSQEYGLIEAIGRLSSIGLQHGVSVVKLIKQLKGISSEYPCWFRFEDTDERPVQILSIPDAVAKLLERYFSDGEPYKPEVNGGMRCPKCNGIMDMTEGCPVCKSCGFSKCS
ncbi:MAG: LAGLIDADG family homing endonuclease [Elusimicrobiota bacterium]